MNLLKHLQWTSWLALYDLLHKGPQSPRGTPQPHPSALEKGETNGLPSGCLNSGLGDRCHAVGYAAVT